jgi:hypothetical protein
LGIHSVYNNNFKYFRKQWLVKYGCYGCQAQGRGLIPLCVCVCVCVCVRARVYGLGNTVGIWIAWSFFSKNVNLPHFPVSGTKTFPSVTHYSKMYSKMSHTKIHSPWNDSCVLQIASTVNVRVFSITPVHQTTRGQPRKSCSDSAGHFLRSWIRPWFSRKYYVLCKETAIALPARCTALAAVTVPVPWYAGQPSFCIPVIQIMSLP